MTTEMKDNLLDWLRDAHAMEEQAETMLTKTAERLENYPDLRARVEQHIQETRHQAEMLRACIQRLGSDTSSVKDATGKMMAMMQGLSGMFVSDEVVKASLASYAFEHMEIASYKALIAAAELCGDLETKRVCEEILAEEEAMAHFTSIAYPPRSLRGAALWQNIASGGASSRWPDSQKYTARVFLTRYMPAGMNGRPRRSFAHQSNKNQERLRCSAAGADQTELRLVLYCWIAGRPDSLQVSSPVSD